MARPSPLLGAVIPLVFLTSLPAQTTRPAVITVTDQAPIVWTIRTAASEYRIALADDNVPVPAGFGPVGRARPAPAQLKVNPKIGSKSREIPFRGGFVEQMPAVEVVYDDHTRDCDLVYDASEILTVDGQPTLRIDLKDPAYGLRVSAFYRVFSELDLSERWLVLRNAGNRPVTVENAQSASFCLPPAVYELTHLTGQWGHEFQPVTEPLTPGVKTLAVRDFSAFANPPFLTIRPVADPSQSAGQVYFAALQYSGNWRLDVQKNYAGDVQVVGGINFWDTSLRLDPGQSFTTPRMVVGFTDDGPDGAARRLHDYVRDHVLPAGFRHKPRPVLYNSWYATTFNVRADQQIELAKVAKEIGVELFCIDDGWFKGRANNKAGLGDWTVDTKKFPDGLGPMIRQVNDLGMDFGLWIEPEMVNPDSDLYRAHPDWTFHYPTRERHEGRNQLMLNLARQDVYDYLLDAMSTLLKENNIKFIKWDRNRSLSEPGWPDAPVDQQHAVRILYTQNLYRLIDALRERFPAVMFESCSGGGGRPDQGMLRRMDQVWVSDNTNPTDRLFIQSGYLCMSPPNTMVSWVTDENWYNATFPLKYRFHASMCGVLGIGSNVTKWSTADRKTAAEMVALYKQIRPIVQEGTVHQLLLPRDGQRVAIQYVARDDSHNAALFLFNLRDELSGTTAAERSTRTIRLRGLDPDAQYHLSAPIKQIYSGRTLMDIGIPWPLKGDYDSAVIQLTPQGN